MKNFYLFLLITPAIAMGGSLKDLEGTWSPEDCGFSYGVITGFEPDIELRTDPREMALEIVSGTLHSLPQKLKGINDAPVITDKEKECFEAGEIILPFRSCIHNHTQTRTTFRKGVLRYSNLHYYKWQGLIGTTSGAIFELRLNKSQDRFKFLYYTKSVAQKKELFYYCNYVRM